ncbi:protein FAM98A-like isoform X2 [Ambystoma mexicanum]|uniref:protein FAM98A-like isoform X2 n=2 Tax=Ambystoma mexicanum TaxID=8296 RepID=UPI0037E95980
MECEALLRDLLMPLGSWATVVIACMDRGILTGDLAGLGPEDADTFQLEMSGLLNELRCPYPSLTTGNVTSRLTTKENCQLLLGPEDADTFQLEMSGLLNELRCPYPSLTTGNVTSRLTTKENCQLLLAFLCSELQAARLLSSRQDPQPKPSEEYDDDFCDELLLIRAALGMPLALDTPVLQQLLEVEAKITEVLTAEPLGLLMNPLLKTPLTLQQWEELAHIHRILQNEYDCRMHMLVARFDVTVTSFHWSERAEHGKGDAMEKLFSPLRQMMHTVSQVTLAHLLAVREDFSCVIKTSSDSSLINTSSSVKKVLMGSVPDRGGRPGEIEPPMPSWEKRREGGGGGGRQQRSGKRNKKKQ